MSPDETRSAPRKRAWKALVVCLACVFGLIMITLVLLAMPAKREPEPVTVSFLKWTNSWPPSESKIMNVFPSGGGAPVTFTRAPGRKQLVFEGSNGLPQQIVFSA